jgi:hypothetical protein
MASCMNILTAWLWVHHYLWSSPTLSRWRSTVLATSLSADNTFIIWPHETNRLRDFLHYFDIKFAIEPETNSHLPFLGTDIYKRPSISLGHTHTNLTSNRSAVLELCVIETDFTWSWCSCGTVSGRTAAPTGRFEKSSTFLRWLPGPTKSQIQSFSCLMSGIYTNASAECCLCTTSSLWVSLPGEYLVSSVGQ